MMVEQRIVQVVVFIEKWIDGPIDIEASLAAIILDIRRSHLEDGITSLRCQCHQE
jgi:hypothetical protein